MHNGSGWRGQVLHSVIFISKFRYLIIKGQKVVVDPEGTQAARIQLDFGRLAIP